MRVCRRGLHEIPAHKDSCVVCKKQRDDRYRLHARLAGKDARRQREWYAARYQDPAFAAKEHARFRAYEARPDVRFARRHGLSIPEGRQILEAAA